MAVQYVGQGGRRGGILGTIGTLASLGGMLIPGAQWLTPLGMGLGAADSLMNGGGGGGVSGSVDALSKLKEAIEGWQNPASGNIAQSESRSKANEVANAIDKSDEELNRTWGRYNQWRL